ncbi:MAG: hypothetical protein HOW73_07755 [Polyangiaceae bacterium]|nr:hypothetical protein [Polyangiaceae bacterium]
MSQSPRGKIASLVLFVARHPKRTLIATAIAFALSLTFLGAGYLLDDRLHTYILDGNSLAGGPRGAWDLYRFADGGDGVRQATREGIFPWWSSPELKFAFFRPIPSLWRAADHYLWGESAVIPHLEAALVFALVVIVAARAYGKVVGGAAAGIATLMFAIDDAHGTVIAWIANRYALLAALFGFASLLLFFPRWSGNAGETSHRRTNPFDSVISAALFGIALFCGEPAIGIFGYVVAAAWFDPRGRRAGLISMAPHTVVFAVWAITYRTLGYGAAGSDFYVDPVQSPVAFAKALVERLPRLTLAQLAVPPSEMWGLFPEAGRPIYAVVTIAVSAAILIAVLRVTRSHPASKILAWGALLAAIPACATNSADRLLLIPGFGAFGLIALFLERVWETASAPRGKRVLAGFFVAVHFVLAPVLLPVSTWNFMKTFGGFVERGVASMPTDAKLAEQHLVVVTAPDVLLTNYVMLETLMADGPKPLGGCILTSQDRGTATIERTGDRTYVLTNPAGQNGGPFGGLYGNGRLRVGDTFDTNVMTVRVLEMGVEDLPTAIQFDFHAPLDEHRWIVWKGRGFAEIPTLAMGERLEIPSTPFFEALQ